ncbi:hypothetical protein EB796_004751 [Bugula neritina]|uniref:Uncharacterized protein n=1 Tax=Bugula neritina TaxID=10212 RepID=A0A7J7KE49_BUGNE|nr:hypothetical protein EB796_004751 [Bugula neritina]
MTCCCKRKKKSSECHSPPYKLQDSFILPTINGNGYNISMTNGGVLYSKDLFSLQNDNPQSKNRKLMKVHETELGKVNDVDCSSMKSTDCSTTNSALPVKSLAADRGGLIINNCNQKSIANSFSFHNSSSVSPHSHLDDESLYNKNYYKLAWVSPDSLATQEEGVEPCSLSSSQSSANNHTSTADSSTTLNLSQNCSSTAVDTFSDQHPMILFTNYQKMSMNTTYTKSSFVSDTSTEQNGTDLTESKELFTTADVTDMFADVTDERADVTDKCADVADMCPDVTNTCTDVTNTCTDDCGVYLMLRVSYI